MLKKNASIIYLGLLLVPYFHDFEGKSGQKLMICLCVYNSKSMQVVYIEQSWSGLALLGPPLATPLAY